VGREGIRLNPTNCNLVYISNWQYDDSLWESRGENRTDNCRNMKWNGTSWHQKGINSYSTATAEMLYTVHAAAYVIVKGAVADLGF